MVDRGGLENRCTALRYRGFESHPLRQHELRYVSATCSPVSRRGARVDDWARLESVCTLTGTVGSNPTPSASVQSRLIRSTGDASAVVRGRALLPDSQ